MQDISAEVAIREKTIVRTSVIGIVTNLLLVGFKAFVGLMSNSIAIILDAVNLIAPETAEHVGEIVEDAIRRLGNRVRVLHMKDFVRLPDGKMRSCACGLGNMRYERLLAFAEERKLPMTLEDTGPGNAEEARLLLEQIAGER